MPYSIGEFARLCGINATTLRAWQRRYGLLKPLRTDGGHRLYSDDDVQQALKILDWVKKGCRLAGEAPAVAPRRAAHQQLADAAGDHAAAAERGKIESLRQLIYDAGREYPRQELVTEVCVRCAAGLRQRTGHHDPARNPRRHHHRLHLVLPRRR